MVQLRRLGAGEPKVIELAYTNPGTDVKELVKIDSEEGITKAINDATHIVAGPGLQIKNVLMELKVCSPDVPDLTVLDLPGITHVPMGDQPKDIFGHLKALYHEYCKGIYSKKHTDNHFSASLLNSGHTGPLLPMVRRP